MIKESKGMDFIRAIENQKKLIKERQEKLALISKSMKNRPKNTELFLSAVAKFKKILLDIVRNNKQMEVADLLTRMGKSENK